MMEDWSMVMTMKLCNNHHNGNPLLDATGKDTKHAAKPK
jgi:hypothetical protein